jgi:hypothetical protein
MRCSPVLAEHLMMMLGRAMFRFRDDSSLERQQ